MTPCRLTVRGPGEVWQGSIDAWTSLVCLAALSAEPESLDELAEALRRYLPGHDLLDRARLADPTEVEAAGPWCLVDLPGRTVVAGAGFELPEPHGAYEAEPDDHAAGLPIVWLDTPRDWLFTEAGDDWRAVVAARSAARAALPRVDARRVLFGTPLLEHLADGVLAAGPGEPDEQRTQEQTRRVHAAWLLTPREDLDGRTPRELLLAERGRLSSDLHHRADQWSRQGHAVPPLPADSAAYRLGGFGTTEVVLYFDLVRALLAEAWELAGRQPGPTRAELVGRLARSRDGWLHSPGEEGSTGMTPAELIEQERRRLPVISDGSPLDDDCPLCRAEAEGAFGPTFVWFDGHHLELEDEFAFSLCETREEWEREQEEYRRFAEEMDRKAAERAAHPGADDGDAPSAWQASYVNWEALVGADFSREGLLLALGFPLAELTNDLRDRPGGRELLASLNAAYAALREREDPVAADSAAREFCDALEAVSRAFPDLTAKSADLQSRVDEVLRRLAQDLS